MVTSFQKRIDYLYKRVSIGIYSYARVNTMDLKLNLQLGDVKIPKEMESAAKERPRLEKMFTLLTEGDS